MKAYGLRQSALGFGKETKMGYYCKINDDGEPYDCTPHFVLLKCIHCQPIDGEIRVSWETITIICTDVERFCLDCKDWLDEVDLHKFKAYDQPWNCKWKNKKIICLSTLDVHDEISTNHHYHEDITCKRKIEQEEISYTLYSKKVL